MKLIDLNVIVDDEAGVCDAVGWMWFDLVWGASIMTIICRAVIKHNLF